MALLPSHGELHTTGRTGWLRAAVLGANDGLLSTASLVLGVAAAGGDRSALLTAGIAGLAAGLFPEHLPTQVSFAPSCLYDDDGAARLQALARTGGVPLIDRVEDLGAGLRLPRLLLRIMRDDVTAADKE